ncbi:MAG: ATP-binding protein [Caldimonas sp.]
MIRALASKARAVAALLAFATLLAIAAVQRGTPGSLLPHGYCFTWNPALLWSHVLSDSLIGTAYVSIPLTLLHLVRKRSDIRFNWIVVLFALFIVSCGATHWIEVWTVWHPDYWLSANVKMITAVASVLTAVALVRLVPMILAIPTLAALTTAKEALESEVITRRRVEQALLLERAELERRVLERTEDLARATGAAEAAHAAAEEANKLKDRFLAKVSHELRTPLQSTLSWAQVLQRAGGDRDQAAHAAGRIVHNVRSQARLIDDLLDISRILSGKLGLQTVPADGFALIGKAVDVVRSGAAARAVEIEVTTDGAPAAPMQTDAVRFEQVVWNLVSNAVQASPDAGRVSVRVRVEGSELKIEVQDWGRGIDPADLPHIFEPFRQGGRRDASHRGLGLGLAITRSIVEQLGGDLRAQSEGPGQGATFSARLPMKAGPEPSITEVDEVLRPDEAERLSGLRVLYVEDDLDIAAAGRLMLESLGAEVALCTDFNEALARIDAGDFDVLLSDLDLGRGHGAPELLVRLRSLPHGAQVPVLVLSAHGSTAVVQGSLAAGFARHLVKPIDATTLARALLEVISN